MLRLIKFILICAVLYFVAARVLPTLPIVKDAQRIVGVAVASQHSSARH